MSSNKKCGNVIFSFHEDLLIKFFHRIVTVVLSFSVNHKQEISKALVNEDNGEQGEEMGTNLQNYCQCLKLCEVSNSDKREYINESNGNTGK